MSSETLEGKIAPASPEEKDAASTYQTLLWMVAAEQEKLRLAQQATSVELANQVRMKGDMERKQGEQIYQLKVERDAHLHGMEQEKGDLKTRKQQLDALEADLAVRRRELDVLTQQAEPLRQLQRTVTDRRVEAEKIRLNALQVADQADAKLREALGKEAEISQRTSELNANTVILQRRSADVEARHADVDTKLEALRKEQDRLESLQAELTPRLEEFSKQKAEQDAAILRGESLLQEGAQKLAEAHQAQASVASASADLEARRVLLHEYEIKLSQVQQELSVKVASSTVSVGIEVPPLP